MIGRHVTDHQNSKHSTMVQTVTNNMQRYTKREISQATKAREMIARMGFPSVENAMSMVGNGTNFDITPRDFKVAESIWGRDLYSMKGNTTRMTSPVADITVGPAVVQQQQVMCIDIMFIEQLPFLVADVSLVKSLSTVDKRRLGTSWCWDKVFSRSAQRTTIRSESDHE